MNKALIGKLLVTGAIVAAMGAPIAASAHPAKAPVGARPIMGRFERQQQRIDRGVANGQLTYKEYARDEARLRADEKSYRTDLRGNDGKLTAAEKAQLRSSLNHNSEHIWFTKHDRAHQPGA